MSGDTPWELPSMARESIEVALEQFETPQYILDHHLKTIGPLWSDKDELWRNIEETYHKYVRLHGTFDVTIITDLVEEQDYKVADWVIKIRNKFKN